MTTPTEFTEQANPTEPNRPARTARPAPGRRLRVLVSLLLVLAIGGLYAILTAQLWAATSTDADFVAAERRGVAYLGPLTQLLGELTAAESAAVRGTAVDRAAVTAAVAAVAAVDAEHGGALGTGQRWADLRAQIEQLTVASLGHSEAMERYVDVVSLTIDLARKVGDTSNLILDPELDCYYLMDTALLRLPHVLAHSARAADHAELGGSHHAGPDLEHAPQVAVARYEVAGAANAVSTGLRKAMDATDRETLGPNLTAPLDAFHTAAGQLVPTVALLQAGGVQPDAMSTAARRVREAALPLATAVLAELDALLAAREARLNRQQVYAIATAVGGVLISLLLLWWALPARGPAGPGAGPGPEPETGVGPPADVAALVVDLPLVDPRELIAAEELLHMGRGVRARPREQSDDAG